MTDPTPLSPAAQAVLDAAREAWITKDDSRSIAAAALRAAADQVVPEPDEAAKATFSFAALRHRWRIRDRFLAIATELENHQ